jgi:hypothetical protein
MVDQPKPTVEPQVMTSHRMARAMEALRAAGIDPKTVTLTAKPTTTVVNPLVKKGVRGAN